MSIFDTYNDTPVLSTELTSTEPDGQMFLSSNDETETSERTKLIVQSAEFGTADIDFVAESISQAVNDLGAITRMQVVIENAKNAPGVPAQLSGLSRARALRDRLQKRYGPLPVAAMESSQSNLGQPGLIFALEEEEKDTKGFFAKIIEKITKAFKWLWEKLTGLFSKEESAEKVAADIDATEAKIEAAVDNGTELSKLVVDTFGINRHFGFTGKPVTLSNVSKHLDEIHKRIPQLRKVMEGANAAFDALIKSTNEARNKPEGLDNSIASHISELIETAMSQIPSGKAEDFEKAGNKEFVSVLHSSQGSKVFTYDGFIEGGVLALAVSPTPNHGVKFLSSFSKNAPKDNDKADVSGITLEEISRLNAQCKAIANDIDKASKDLAKLTAANTAKTDALKRGLDSLPTDKGDSARYVLIYSGYSTSISSLYANAASAYKAIGESRKAVKKFTEEVLAAIASGKQQEKQAEGQK